MKATDFWIGCHIYKSCRSFEKFWDFGHFSRSFEGERAILLEGCQCSAVHIPKSNIFLPWRCKSAEILKFDVSWNNWISVQQEKKQYLDFYSEFIPYHSSALSEESSHHSDSRWRNLGQISTVWQRHCLQKGPYFKDLVLNKDLLWHFGSLLGPYLYFRVLIFTILVSFTQRMSI